MTDSNTTTSDTILKVNGKTFCLKWEILECNYIKWWIIGFIPLKKKKQFVSLILLLW